MVQEGRASMKLATRAVAVVREYIGRFLVGGFYFPGASSGDWKPAWRLYFGGKPVDRVARS
jgi:hypothetical protein